nr:hypothetical protein [Bradyrhizobium sp. Ce-3]
MPFGKNVNDADWVLRLIGYFQSPFLARHERAIQVLEELSGGEGGLFPRSVLARKFDAGFIGVTFTVVEMKEITKHLGWQIRIIAVNPAKQFITYALVPSVWSGSGLFLALRLLKEP